MLKAFKVLKCGGQKARKTEGFSKALKVPPHTDF
jgi:hypothetical protein